MPGLRPPEPSISSSAGSTTDRARHSVTPSRPRPPRRRPPRFHLRFVLKCRAGPPSQHALLSQESVVRSLIGDRWRVCQGLRVRSPAEPRSSGSGRVQAIHSRVSASPRALAAWSGVSVGLGDPGGPVHPCPAAVDLHAVHVRAGADLRTTSTGSAPASISPAAAG